MQLEIPSSAQYTKTVSLNPGAAPDYITSGGKTIGKTSTLVAGNFAGGMRAMSLASRPDVDPLEVVQRAKELCKQPIKLSWENVFFEVEVATTQ